MAAATVRSDWLLALLASWMIGGFFIDLWAHGHGQVDDTFFTPWHAILYSGAASIGIALGLIGARGLAGGLPWRQALPPPYRLPFVGSVLFVVAGLLDLAWHEAFGFEVDTASLLSPTHLALAIAGMLMISGPILGAAERVGHGWRPRGPIVVAVGLGLAILLAMTQYANPIVEAWAAPANAAQRDVGAELNVMNADGSAQRRLTISDLDERAARFSPDGRSIAYAAAPAGTGDYRVYVAAADGSSAVAVTEETETSNSGQPDWSPDGTRLVFYSTRDGDAEIYTMAIDGSDVRQLTDDPAEDWGASWSPDGTQIAWNSNRNGSYDLYRMPADGGTAVAVTTDPGDEWEPAWSPDGTTIAYTGAPGECCGVWVIPTAGGTAIRLTDPTDGAWTPAWSPDGRTIAYTTGTESSVEVAVMSPDGANRHLLSRSPRTDDGWSGADWSPDGSTIIYSVDTFAPADTTGVVREQLGAASILLQAAFLAGMVLLAVRIGRLPFGSLTVIVGASTALMTVISDAWAFIPGGLLAGFAADVLLVRLRPGSGRRRSDLAFGFLVPALWFAAYFVTLALTEGIGWTVHLWLGAIVLGGLVGAMLALLAFGPTWSTGVPAPPTAHEPSTKEASAGAV